MQLSRSDFLKASLATFGVAVAGCSESDPGVGGAGGTGGLDGATGGTGGLGTGGAASGGTGTGGAGTGGQASGGTGTGGAGTGGESNGTGGENNTDSCAAEVMVTSSGQFHTHTLTIPLATIQAGGEVSIATSNDGQGEGHTHQVTITAEDFTALKNGEHVTISSCDGGHYHQYVLSCVAGAPAPTVSGCPI